MGFLALICIIDISKIKKIKNKHSSCILNDHYECMWLIKNHTSELKIKGKGMYAKQHLIQSASKPKKS